MNRFSLEGHVALVTGSTRGLGLPMALGLAEAGARVAMNYHNDEAMASRAFAQLENVAEKALLVRADVTDKGQIDAMVEQIASTLGPVDILIPNATCVQPQKPIEEYDWDWVQTMIDFFIKSPFLLTQACLPGMKEKGWGRLINIGSEVFNRGTPNFTAYVAAKGGQAGLTRSLASELAPFNITSNILAPGWIPVERHESDPQELKDGYRATIPMNRWGVPEDVVGAAVFLASDAASFITGQTICINGGLSLT